MGAQVVHGLGASYACARPSANEPTYTLLAMPLVNNKGAYASKFLIQYYIRTLFSISVLRRPEPRLQRPLLCRQLTVLGSQWQYLLHVGTGSTYDSLEYKRWYSLCRRIPLDK